MKRLALITIGLASPWAVSQEAEPAIPSMAVKKALQWMQNPDPAKREAAYRTFQLDGDEGGAIYRRTLEKAEQIHTKKLAELLGNTRTNPFAELEEVAGNLKDERERIYKLIKTDYKKAPDKIAMLRREVDSLSALYQRALKIAAKDSAAVEKSINTVATALSEVYREINLIDGEKEKASECTAAKALEESYEGSVFLKTKETAKRLKKEVTDLQAAHQEVGVGAGLPRYQRLP